MDSILKKAFGGLDGIISGAMRKRGLGMTDADGPDDEQTEGSEEKLREAADTSGGFGSDAAGKSQTGGLDDNEGLDEDTKTKLLKALMSAG